MAKRKHRSGSRPPRKGGKKARISGGGPYWLYGIHPTDAALSNQQREILGMRATPQAVERLGATARARLEKDPALRVDQVGRGDLDALFAAGAVHQGVAIEVRPLEFDNIIALKAVGERTRSLVVALDQVTDPQNVGAILRSAAFFGARAVIMTGHHAPPESGALAKAAAGALDMVPLVRAGNLSAALRELRDAGYWVIGLADDADGTLSDGRTHNHLVLVLGAEGTGLRRLTAETCDALADIPRPPDATAKMDNLNVSNAAAVALAMVSGDQPAGDGG